MTMFPTWPKEIRSVDELLVVLGVAGKSHRDQEEKIIEFMNSMQRVAPESIKQELRDRNLFGYPKRRDREGRHSNA